MQKEHYINGKFSFEDQIRLAEKLQEISGEKSGWAPDSLPAENPEFWFCDVDGSGLVEAAEQTNANFVWHMGSANELPALHCSPGGVQRQR